MGAKVKRRLSISRKASAQEELGTNMLRKKVEGNKGQASSTSDWNKRFSTL